MSGRYHSAAIVLHWLIALAVMMMLCSGLVLEYGPEMPKADKFWLVQLHKSMGVTILVAVFLRILVRVTHKPPALPAHIALWEQKAAKLGHLGLYAVLVLMPLSGWIMVSASPYGLPTLVFNLFEWPHIPGLAGNEKLGKFARQSHTVIGFTLIALVLGHVAAVIKHLLCDRENLLRRMWWTKPVLVLLALTFAATPALAKPYDVNTEISRIGFSGTHADSPFSGYFKDWQAEIDFDPAHPEKTAITATIKTASAVTGNKMFDGALPTGDWLASKTYPVATFKSLAVRASPEGGYDVTGDLSLRGVTQPVTFSFMLDNAESALVAASATFTLDRFAYGIGMKSDATAEWVSKDITITLKLTATRNDEIKKDETADAKKVSQAKAPATVPPPQP